MKYEERDKNEKISKEVVSPKGAGSNTLTLEDFQSKVNSLKERYGLIILKKSPEITETATKSPQTTNATDKKLQETFTPSNNIDIASQYPQGPEWTNKKEVDAMYDKESTKFRGFEELSRLGALGANNYASSSFDNKTIMGSNLGLAIAPESRTRIGSGANFASTTQYGYGASTIVNNNTSGVSLASNIGAENNLSKNTIINRVETVTNTTIENNSTNKNGN